MSTTVVSSNTESKTMDELIPKPLTRDTPVKNELNSVKEVKHENINRSMSVDDFERLLNDDDMNIDEIETSPDDDILLEVEQFLDS
ncbi:hypothetical protein NPIL_483971 [Nephila pilipes]|uniref:Uncharacterized protein n=1 Tax=Nephila pilipes TaxID=299642 RepID=A0A8X6U426_NEPPI|nr:hypothetical protein NPIL_483971 [Nephila pilipes]